MNVTIRIETGDFRDLSKDLPDGSIDAIITDPPYAERYLPLWADLGAMAARVLKPGGFLVAYSGQMHLPDVMARLGTYLQYYWLGGLRHGGQNGMVWPRKLRNAVKPILVYAKEPVRKQPRCFVDLVDSARPSKTYHEWGQDLSAVTYLLEVFTRPGDLVLDPFCGGGTTLVACLQAGRSCIGFEVDAATAEVARARLASVQLPLFVPEPIQAALELVEV